MIDWNPEKDIYIRKRAIELHEKLHSKMASKNITISHLRNQGKRRWRRGVIDILEGRIGRVIYGKILEIGVGDGYLSAHIASTRPIGCIYAMEYDKPAVNTLIPKAFQAYNIPTEKYKIVYGSFNRILEKDFDFIISMGAIHHSENLEKTMESCYSSLKPSGYMVCSEPMVMDDVTDEEIRKMLNATNKGIRFGESFKVFENSDHFYRLREYLSCANNAGFSCDYVLQDDDPEKDKLLLFLKK